MSLDNKKIDESMLEDVGGGVYMDNFWGDGQTYKIGKVGGSFTHTFKKSDKSRVDAIIAANTVKGRSQAEDDAAIMAALINSGLLTPIG